MTTQQYDAEIQRLRSQISTKTSQIQANKNNISEHQSNIQKDNGCKGKTGKNKTNCQGVNTWRSEQISLLTASNTQLTSDIQSLEKQISDLLKARETSALTDSEVAKVLAGQGLTFASVQTLAEKQGEAEVEKQRTVAQAEAQAVNDKANTNKTIGYVIIAVIAVGAIVGIGFLIKKLRKK